MPTAAASPPRRSRVRPPGDRRGTGRWNEIGTKLEQAARNWNKRSGILER